GSVEEALRAIAAQRWQEGTFPPVPRSVPCRYRSPRPRSESDRAERSCRHRADPPSGHFLLLCPDGAFGWPPESVLEARLVRRAPGEECLPLVNTDCGSDPPGDYSEISKVIFQG